MSEVVVVGGGIAGLAAARQLAATHHVVLLEAEPSVGGKLKSTLIAGRPVDLGPDAFITRTPAARELCCELGLEDQLVAPAANSVALAARGGLRGIPAGIVLGIPTDLRALRKADVVRGTSLLHAASDLLRRKAVLPTDALTQAREGRFDPSVGDVFAPRLGEEIVRTLVDPLLGGINASDVSALSLAASAPQLVARIAGQKSVVKALRAEPATFRPAGTLPPFLGLADGMGSLAHKLRFDLERKGVEVRCDEAVTALDRDAQRWVLSSGEGSSVADAVVLAIPAHAATSLLETVDEALADELGAIAYAGIAVVCFAWRSADIPKQLTDRLRTVVRGAGDSQSALPGSGVLVPRDGERLLTSATFTSTKWSWTAASDEVVIRCFAGRRGDERALELTDDELVSTIRREIAALLGIDAEPCEVVLQRWPKALPQFVTGHLARLQRIDACLDRLGTLAVAGAAYQGVGLPACIESAATAAGRIERALATTKGPAS